MKPNRKVTSRHATTITSEKKHPSIGQILIDFIENWQTPFENKVAVHVYYELFVATTVEETLDLNEDLNLANII